MLTFLSQSCFLTRVAVPRSSRACTRSCQRRSADSGLLRARASALRISKQFVPSVSILDVAISGQHPKAVCPHLLPMSPRKILGASATADAGTVVCRRVWTGWVHTVKVNPYTNVDSHGLLQCLLPLCGNALPRISVIPIIIIFVPTGFRVAPLPFSFRFKTAGRWTPYFYSLQTP